MADFLHPAALVAGVLVGLFVGLAPFALVAVVVLAQLDPKRKENGG